MFGGLVEDRRRTCADWHRARDIDGAFDDHGASASEICAGVNGAAWAPCAKLVAYRRQQQRTGSRSRVPAMMKARISSCPSLDFELYFRRYRNNAVGSNPAPARKGAGVGSRPGSNQISGGEADQRNRSAAAAHIGRWSGVARLGPRRRRRAST